jgi:hypothetical protein
VNVRVIAATNRDLEQLSKRATSRCWCSISHARLPPISARQLPRSPNR